MRVAAQGANEIALGRHGTQATVAVVKHCRANDDAVLDAVGKIELRRDGVYDGINI